MYAVSPSLRAFRVEVTPGRYPSSERSETLSLSPFLPRHVQRGVDRAIPSYLILMNPVSLKYGRGPPLLLVPGSRVSPVPRSHAISAHLSAAARGGTGPGKRYTGGTLDARA